MSETGRIAILTGEKHIEIKTLPLPEINDNGNKYSNGWNKISDCIE